MASIENRLKYEAEVESATGGSHSVATAGIISNERVRC